MPAPSEFVSGDSVTWSVTLPLYPAASGWAVTYAARGAGSIDITSTGADDVHTVSITAAATAALVPGAYTLQGYAANAGTGLRVTFYTGRLLVRANVAAAVAGYDGRSHARRVLDAVEAVLEGRAGKEIMESAVDGLVLKSIPHEKLLLLRQKYLAFVGQETTGDALNAGQFGAGRILVRFES